MLVKPTVLQLLKHVDNRYILVTATAKRARQIAAGSKPLTSKEEQAIHQSVVQVSTVKTLR